MKGLILKDLYMTRKYFRNYLFILILFLGLSFADGDNLFMVFYPGMICALIPVNLLAYDERSHWDIYSLTLPVTRDMAVSAKYLLGLILLGSVYLLTAATQALRMVLDGSFVWESYLVLMSLVWMAFLVASSVSLPFMFKLGVEKGRTAYYVMIGIICGCSAASAYVMDDLMAVNISFGTVLIIGCLIAAAVYACSWYLSVVFYRKRELH